MRSRASFAVLAVLVASPAVRADSKADEAAIENYRLTMPVLKKMVQVQENLFAAIKKDPSVATRYKRVIEISDESLDATVKKMDGVPELKQAIAKAGLTTREFLLATVAMVQAGMAGAMARQPRADTSKLPANVRANMRFLEENQAAIAQLQKRTDEIERETTKLTAKKTKEGEEAEEEPPADDGPDKK
jgi:hypothetical protein